MHVAHLPILVGIMYEAQETVRIGNGGGRTAEVSEVVRTGLLLYVQALYSDDPTITIVPLDLPRLTEFDAVLQVLQRYNEADFYPTGSVWRKLPLRITHSYLRHLQRSTPQRNFILSFYSELGLDFTKLLSYFYLPLVSEELPSQRLVFLQTVSSSQQLNRSELWRPYLENSEYLVVDPNKNHYPADHSLYSLAASWVNRPLLAYVDLIRHAEVLIVIDSSFYCLAALYDLGNELKATTKLCFTRFDYHYADFNPKFTYQAL